MTASGVASSEERGLESPPWGGFDPSRTHGRGVRDTWRSFATAARLGWQMEANWTDPVLFFIYSVAKPLSTTLIFIVMIDVVGGASTAEYKAFVVVGTALWSLVLSGIAGLAWSILDDRERYRMLKYIYVSPSDFIITLVGRGVARLAVGAMGALITLAVGVVALGVGFDPARVDWLLLAAVTVIGLVAIIAIGVVLAAICIQTRQESWSYPEAAAGALFLVSGAVFPLAVLPSPAQVVGWMTPLTWWIEGVRRAVFPAGISGIGGPESLFASYTGRPVPDSGEVVIALLATGAVVTLAAAVVFRISERRAKNRGLLDQTTGS
ncbi:MAG TPA: ABC transporter permease [Candidatus Limnocylindrales bacterium]|nr:ABC transporter permease [Candidatus Limnocylindrales bacterium]